MAAHRLCGDGKRRVGRGAYPAQLGYGRRSIGFGGCAVDFEDDEVGAWGAGKGIQGLGGGGERVADAGDYGVGGAEEEEEGEDAVADAWGGLRGARG
jgi:hypothetical protein